MARKTELEKLTQHILDMATSVKDKAFALKEMHIYEQEQLSEMKRIDMKMMIVMLLKEMEDWTKNKVDKIVNEIPQEYHTDVDYIEIMLNEKIKLYQTHVFEQSTIVKYICLTKLNTWFKYSEHDDYATII